MKKEIDGTTKTYCDFCNIDDSESTLVDAGRAAICHSCVSKCFMILMAQLNKPSVEIKTQAMDNAQAPDIKTT